MGRSCSNSVSFCFLFWGILGEFNMNMATKNDNARVIEPEIKMISGRKTIIDKAYTVCNPKPSFSDLSDDEFMKIMGVTR